MSLQLEHLPTSRADAVASGSKVYFTGEPCRHGHVSERRTGNGECSECARESARRRAALVPRDVKNRRDREYLHRNRDEICSRRRDRYAENPGKYRRKEADTAWNGSAAGKAYKRQWTIENRDRLNGLSIEWRRRNADSVKAAKALYYKNNPHISRDAAQRRRAIKSSADGHYTQADIERITKAQGGKCACCGRKRKLTIDHIVSLNKGGSNWLRNIQMLCLSCNTSKQDRDPIEFMRLRGVLL